MEPFLLKAIIKNYIWGGERLIREFGYDAGRPAAEAWVLSCRNGDENVVGSGEYNGRALSEVPGVDKESFPLLVKLIDAERDLSVQVHPDSRCAEKFGDSEKFEMWYVIACRDGASLICGFNEEFERKRKEEGKEVFRREITRVISEGRILDVTKRVTVHPGDVFCIEPGTIHAIGSGILLAEVQQNSDTTYRVFDYNRKDSAGRRRELHTEKAIEAVVTSSAGESSFSESTEEKPFGTVRSISCRHFSFDVISLSGDTGKTSRDVFRSCLVLSGSAVIASAGGTLPISKGDSVFIPAGSVCSISGDAELLISSS